MLDTNGVNRWLKEWVVNGQWSGWRYWQLTIHEEVE